MGLVAPRRIMVYLLAGALVVGVGGWGLLSTRQATGETAAVIEAGVGVQGDTAARAGDLENGGAGDPAGAVATTLRQVYVQVLGAVRNPGVYTLPSGSRVFQAVEAAGGFAPDADADAVSMAALAADGGRIVVPTRGASSQGPPPAGSGGGGAEPAAGGPAAPVSLSTATPQELDTLPGIGPAIAARIVEYREKTGPFASVEDLEDVPGIGPALVERLRDLVVP